MLQLFKRKTLAKQLRKIKNVVNKIEEQEILKIKTYEFKNHGTYANI